MECGQPIWVSDGAWETSLNGYSHSSSSDNAAFSVALFIACLSTLRDGTDSGNASSPNSSSSVAYNNDTYVSVDDDSDNMDKKGNGNVAMAIMASQSCSSADSRLVSEQNEIAVTG